MQLNLIVIFMLVVAFTIAMITKVETSYFFVTSAIYSVLFMLLGPKNHFDLSMCSCDIFRYIPPVSLLWKWMDVYSDQLTISLYPSYL